MAGTTLRTRYAQPAASRAAESGCRSATRWIGSTSRNRRRATGSTAATIAPRPRPAARRPPVSQSSANEPIGTSPAGSYVPIITPVLDTVLSTIRSPAGTVPSANSRFPRPTTTGKTHSR